MRITICDDMPKELKMIRKAVDAYAEIHTELSFDIDEYSAATDVLNAVEKGKTYDIALLDICMPGILGTDVAEQMLARNPKMSVIFLTTSDEYAVAAFALNAAHYLLKPFSQEQFNEALNRALEKTAKDQDYLELACVDGRHRVPVSGLVAIESQGHYLLYHLSGGETLRQRGKLAEMYEKIQKYPEFIRVGASYAANLNFVQSIFRNSMEMRGGTKIPIPRRSSEEVQNIYMEFCRREVRQ